MPPLARGSLLRLDTGGAVLRELADMRSLVAAGAVLLVLAGSPVLAQQGRQVPNEASQSLKEATGVLEQIRGSNLDRWWRANAVARTVRTLARLGDEESARTLGRDTVLILREEGAAPPVPPAPLTEAATFAILSQAYVDLRDPQPAIEAANEALRLVGENPANRAAVMPILAMALTDLGDRAGAGNMALEGLKSAAALPAGRDRLAALSTIALVQAKLGDKEFAAATLTAAKESLLPNAGPADKAMGLAYAARVLVALGDNAGGRLSAREAIRSYDQSVTDAAVPVGQRVTTLCLIAISQAEAGDKGSARQIMRLSRQTASGITGPYERLIALLSLADAALIVEK